MIMKIAFTFLTLALAVLVDGCASGQILSSYRWTATIHIVGEDGNPIPGADVSIQYTLLPPPLDPNAQQYGEI